MRAGPALLIQVALALIVAGLAIGTPADADLWGHVKFGQDALATHQVGGVDPYSFTSDRPWINHEWLAEVAFAKTFDLGGPAGLIALKVLMIAALVALCWRHARTAGATPRLAIVLSVLLMIGTYWRMHNVRPQLFSVLLFAALLVLLSRADALLGAINRADAGTPRALWAVPFIFLLWANLHGGWLVGAGVLGVWTAFMLVRREVPVQQKVMVAGIGVAALLATLVNPHGYGLWQFLGATVRLTRPDIDDWGSILVYPLLLGIPWLLVLSVGLIALWRGRDSVRLSHAAIVVGLAVAAARLSRLDAFFAVAVVILLAEYAGRVWPSAARSAGTSPAAKLEMTGAGPVVITVLGCAAMLYPAVTIIRPYTTCLPIVSQPEPSAAAFIKENKLSGRVLTNYNWGEYVIWHFAPDLKVSMDGRRETVYSDDMIWAHWRFYRDEPGADEFLQRIRPDYIWLPGKLPLLERLAREGWIRIFDGPVSAILARDGTGPYSSVSASPASASPRRCFPGP